MTFEEAFEHVFPLDAEGVELMRIFDEITEKDFAERRNTGNWYDGCGLAVVNNGIAEALQILAATALAS